MRGTWFDLRYCRGYEIYGLLVRRIRTHLVIERIKTMSERSILDHRLKLVRVRKEVKKWRTSGPNVRRVPRYQDISPTEI